MKAREVLSDDVLLKAFVKLQAQKKAIHFLARALI